MSTVIYYFSGTGNSIYLAKELQKRIPEIILRPVLSALKHNDLEPKEEAVGVIFPIHAHTIPKIIKEFLQKINLDNVSYFFAFSNRECADKVFKDINKLLKKRKYKLNASFEVMMPVNYIPVFAVPTEEEISKLENEMQSKLDVIQEYIVERIPYHVKTGPVIFILANSLLRFSTFLFHKTKYFGLQKSFYADDKCKSCGTCEKICLSEIIEIVNGKPKWNMAVECIYCFACISYCPQTAIQAKGKRTTKKGRYHHPLITANEIAKQKV